MNKEEFISFELEKLLTEERISRIDSVLKNRTTSLTIVLENIAHSHNISAVLRSADAFGISKVHILNSDKSSGNIGLSDGISLGSEKWVEVEFHTSKSLMVTSLKEQGFTLSALVPPNISAMEKKNQGIELVPVSRLPFEKPLALLFGNEVNGLSKELTDAADILAFIPMYGFVESFNISVACAITLFCSTIEESSPSKRTDPITPEQNTFLRQDWIKKSVQNVDLVIKSLLKRIPNENK